MLLSQNKKLKYSASHVTVKAAFEARKLNFDPTDQYESNIVDNRNVCKQIVEIVNKDVW